MSTVHETCSCGATFDYTSHSDVECRISVQEWRREHRHHPPEAEQHDTTLDAYVERSGNDPDPKAELDQRMGFR